MDRCPHVVFGRVYECISKIQGVIVVPCPTAQDINGGASNNHVVPRARTRLQRRSSLLLPETSVKVQNVQIVRESWNTAFRIAIALLLTRKSRGMRCGLRTQRTQLALQARQCEARAATHPEHIHLVSDADGRVIVCGRRKRPEGRLGRARSSETGDLASSSQGSVPRQHRAGSALTCSAHSSISRQADRLHPLPSFTSPLPPPAFLSSTSHRQPQTVESQTVCLSNKKTPKNSLSDALSSADRSTMVYQYMQPMAAPQYYA